MSGVISPISLHGTVLSGAQGLYLFINDECKQYNAPLQFI
jgi:hypothetical protein